ncbi:hypothetical protein C1646_691621 [Rhizophagus diaphanus]|nr:hypothetical protein C1646_691621 [Rhizophagus diaphanus] [Rhizophagus sp. MUCL 43196]
MFLQKISLLMSLLSPIAWFTWFTYAVILPLCTFLGWLALPSVFFALVIANVFVIIQLLKGGYQSEIRFHVLLYNDNLKYFPYSSLFRRRHRRRRI